MYGWPAEFNVAKNTLICDSISVFKSSVIVVCQPPPCSVRAQAWREPLRDWSAFTVVVKATSLAVVSVLPMIKAPFRQDLRVHRAIDSQANGTYDPVG